MKSPLETPNRDEVPSAKVHRKVFFLLSWLLLLFVLRQLLPETAFADGFTRIYTVLLYGTYAAIYLVPTFIVAWILRRFFRAEKSATGVAIVGVGLTTVLLYADAKIHSLYGFHINGFVLNLATTPGGISSLGGDAGTSFYFGVILTALLLLPWGLWWISQRRFWPKPPIPRTAIITLSVLALAHWENA